MCADWLDFRHNINKSGVLFFTRTELIVIIGNGVVIVCHVRYRDRFLRNSIHSWVEEPMSRTFLTVPWTSSYQSFTVLLHVKLDFSSWIWSILALSKVNYLSYLYLLTYVNSGDILLMKIPCKFCQLGSISLEISIFIHIS